MPCTGTDCKNYCACLNNNKAVDSPHQFIDLFLRHAAHWDTPNFNGLTPRDMRTLLKLEPARAAAPRRKLLRGPDLRNNKLLLAKNRLSAEPSESELSVPTVRAQSRAADASLSRLDSED